MRGTVTNHCVHHPWIKMSGKIHRDSSFQELYYRVCKPQTETESNVTVILSGENRRDGTESAEAMYSNHQSILAATIHQDRGYYTTIQWLIGEQNTTRNTTLKDRAIQRKRQGCPWYRTHYGSLKTTGVDRQWC